ncbi:MAG: YwqG family protein, partial [Ruminococcus flavefaciens]|nr:YwqG family protein [Ruminococcus flavefaciens]
MAIYKDGETRPCIRFSLTYTRPSVFESKAGGLGYIPHDGSFPTDKDDVQLRLLAQIECEKVQLGDFPKKGLLQFWILNSDKAGMDWDDQTNQDGFRVIYYPEVDRTVTFEEVMSKYVQNKYDEDNMPVLGEFGMEFFEDTSRYYDWDNEETYDMDTSDSGGHQIGGIPYFAQEDPRECQEHLQKYDYLLFQLDT